LGSFTLRGVRVLDAGGAFTGPCDLAVRDGLIDALAPKLPLDADIRDLDGAGLWLLPGIVDAHVHAATHTDDLGAALRTPASYRAAETLFALRRLLDSGVTLARDLGGLDAGIRDALAAGLAEGPEVQISVVPLSQTGGHGDGFLPATGTELSVAAMLPEYPGRPAHTADGVDGVRRWTREVLRAGADWIKVFATGGVLSAAGSGTADTGVEVSPDFPQELTSAEIAVAVAEAARRGKPVAVHALGGPAIATAVRAGARSIEHAIWLTESDAALMAARDVVLVPTLSIYAELAAAARAGTLSGAAAERAAAVGAVLGENVRIARAAGVRIARGSDIAHRDSHGRSLREIAALCHAGMDPSAALLAATREGARLCGVADRTGSLTPGRRFDAAVLDAEPTDPVVFTDPATVTAVFRAGRPVRPHARWRTPPSPAPDAGGPG
jgi:imidazolonepropionase-like amidohydrolase